MEVDGVAEDECVSPSEAKDYAACPHGPALLFAKRKDGRRYYACSASRDRKFCSFFLFAEKVPSVETVRVWRSMIEAERSSSDEEEATKKRLKMVKSSPPSDRRFCQEPLCSDFVLPEQVSLHDASHRLMKKVTDGQLKRPTELLTPLEDPKFTAQFIFDDASAGVVVKILADLELRNVVCLGTPKIHEALRAKGGSFKSYLLDIDARFRRFFDRRSFSRFNMFNAYHFSTEAAAGFKDFLSHCTSPPVVIVDPPFGGRVHPLFATLRHLLAAWLEARGLTSDAPEAKLGQLIEIDRPSSEFLLPVLWAFPYFLEGSVQKERSEFVMLDYKVSYKNHPLFRNDGKQQQQQQQQPRGKGGSTAATTTSSKGSPIRLFTNVKPSLIRLPEPDHKYCSSGCDRWVARENKHCARCDACTSKDGTTYVHCDACRKCVKPSRAHCGKCGRCELPRHFCRASEEKEKIDDAVDDDGKTRNGDDEEKEEEDDEPRCFECGNAGHKRRYCPQNWAAAGNGKRKRRGNKNGGKKIKK